jgi:predicted DNA-binding transcriptional regulator AlpA
MQKQAKKNTSKKDTETYLDVSQVAELTHYSQQTIRMKVMGDEIPSFKLNGRRLFRESDILNWISNGGR